jgi:ATP-dependent Lon protease
VTQIDDPSRLSDFIAANLPSLSPAKDRSCWKVWTWPPSRAPERQLGREVEVLQIGSKIQSEVQDQVTQSQREYSLREQMKAIQKELGEEDVQEGSKTAQADRGRRNAGGGSQRGASGAQSPLEDVPRGRRLIT